MSPFGFLLISASLAGASTPRAPKRGFVADGNKDFSPQTCSDAELLDGCGWFYDYNPANPFAEIGCSAKEQRNDDFIPMHWCISSLNDTVPSNVSTKYMLGFNEPNNAGNCNKPPREIAQAWGQIMHDFPDSELVTPATAGNHTEYFDQFFGNCTELYGPSGCNVTYMAVHDYSCTPDLVMLYLEQLWEKYKLPLWLTEFACGDHRAYKSEEENYQFMSELVPRLDAADFVYRYAWMSARQHEGDHRALLAPPNGTSSPQLTRLGQLYNTIGRLEPATAGGGGRSSAVVETEGADELTVRVPYTTSLESTRDRVRSELSRRRKAALTDASVPTTLVVDLPSGRLAPGLRLDERDSGVKGKLRVVWRGADDGTTSLDGGVSVTGWTPVEGKPGLWQAPAPAGLDGGPNGTVFPVRQLYVNQMRYNRTASPPEALGLGILSGAKIVDDGYLTPSDAPLQWADATAVEIVADFTWVQHRCRVVSVGPPPPQYTTTARTDGGACNWSDKVSGASPGSSLGENLNISSWEACQGLCCGNETKCKGIIYNAKDKSCYLLDRSYKPNYIPRENSYVADMNGPPPPTQKSYIQVSRPCWDIARHEGYGQLGFPSFVENTGNLSTPGTFWLDRTKGVFYLRVGANDAGLNVSTASVVAAARDGPLLEMSGVTDHEWQNVTFAHSAWLQPIQPSGFVERYGNVRFANVERTLSPPQAAVMIAAGRRVSFTQCTFTRLGQWGLRLYNGTQDSIVSRCRFEDLSGGGLCLGNVNDTQETDATLHTGRLTISDNSIVNVGLEFRGAPGMHSFCIANSTIEHNEVRNVGYTGISYNWPDPQGPTLGPDADSPKYGYSANNIIRANDISRFMGYMIDGGGVHTIGRSYNTTLEGNYFHDIAAGTPGHHSPHGQSIIYIDNYSCDFYIKNNVVDNCENTIQGYYYFQNARIGLAHDNYIDGLFLRLAGSISGHGAECNCSSIQTTPQGQPFPEAARDIIANAGPRP